MPKPFNPAEYLASYTDLQLAYGPDPAAAAWHWQVFGQGEGRTCDFDGLRYVAGYDDLRAAFGADPTAGAMHYVRFGHLEGRGDHAFDAAQYLDNYDDLRAAYGDKTSAAAWHFITFGAREGRSDRAPPGRTIIGTDGPDTLRGGPGPDFIDGLKGDDVINGGRGDDTIHGGMGGDTVTGGPGADTFTFGSPWTVPTAAKMWDGGHVTDFQPGVDKLDFSNLISDKGYDATFIGAGPLSTSPPFSRDSSYSYVRGDFDSVEVGYRHEGGNTTVIFDGPVNIQSAKFNATPMDGNIDARITLVGLHTLTAGDFIF